MSAKTALLVALSLCLSGTPRTAQAEMIATASLHAPNSSRASNGEGLANQQYFSDSAPQSAVLTGTALAENIPELATWAMMLAGLGAIGTGLRMRRGPRPLKLEKFRGGDRHERKIPGLHRHGLPKRKILIWPSVR